MLTERAFQQLYNVVEAWSKSRSLYTASSVIVRATGLDHTSRKERDGHAATSVAAYTSARALFILLPDTLELVCE